MYSGRKLFKWKTFKINSNSSRRILMKKTLIKIFLFLLFISATAVKSKDNFIVIQSTTSIRDSGFYEHIKKKFIKNYGFGIKVVAVGTGQAIKNAEKCDADILFVHHKPSELNFVRNGFGIYRKEVMYNEFVLIGPKEDPANIRNIKEIKLALNKIKSKKKNFVTRGDQSGTHKKELELWKQINPKIPSNYENWYIETGAGMGSSLNIAVNKNAYILSDKSSWLSFGNKRNHQILLQNDPSLINVYGIIPINPENCPDVKKNEAEIFINWLTSQEGQIQIDSFRKNGKQLFFSLFKF